MQWSHIFPSEIQVCVFSFKFSGAIFTPLISLFFGHKVVDVFKVCCYCCLILLFVLTWFLNDG